MWRVGVAGVVWRGCVAVWWGRVAWRVLVWWGVWSVGEVGGVGACGGWGGGGGGVLAWDITSVTQWETSTS